MCDICVSECYEVYYSVRLKGSIWLLVKQNRYAFWLCTAEWSPPFKETKKPLQSAQPPLNKPQAGGDAYFPLQRQEAVTEAVTAYLKSKQLSLFACLSYSYAYNSSLNKSEWTSSSYSLQ